MQISKIILATSIAHTAAASALSTGQHVSMKALERIMGRQSFELCKSVPIKSCSLSCGSGYEICVSWPTCYNPQNGESCCSNGKYCEAGYYCTDAGCCPVGTSLTECGARQSLGVIPAGSVPDPTLAPSDSSPSTTRRTTAFPTSTASDDDDDDFTFTSTTSRRATTTSSASDDDSFFVTTSTSSTSRRIASGAASSVSSAVGGAVTSAVAGGGGTASAGEKVRLGGMGVVLGGVALVMAVL